MIASNAGIIVVIQASLYGSSIITLKMLSLSNIVGGLEPVFSSTDLDVLLLGVHFLPDRGGQVVSIFEWNDCVINYIKYIQKDFIDSF